MAKRLAAMLLCMILFALPALAEEPDEQDIALTDEIVLETELEAASDAVYALSDVEEDEVAEQIIDSGEVPAFVRQLLAIAEAEIGYEEGPDNLTKYGEWSGDKHAAWCAEFVCWCVNQVDETNGTALLYDVYPKWSGQNTGRDWFLKRGRFAYRKGTCPGWGSQWLKGDDHTLEKNEYIPRPGDLMFFSYNEAGDTEHVALVEYCAYNSAGEVIVHVIEGNNPSKVQRSRYRLNSSQVLGFGLCQDLVDTTMRSGNQGDKVLALQQALNRIGLLAERHLTGGYGGNTKRAVMDFQQDYMENKTPTGIADRETQQAIEEMLIETIFEDPMTWLVE
ncbi:MAG: peptidoglycan-binding protein [Clostridia bacterium]|nr:peptidoglycan-binding protein [Clostridia bacterium]